MHAPTACLLPQLCEHRLTEEHGLDAVGAGGTAGSSHERFERVERLRKLCLADPVTLGRNRAQQPEKQQLPDERGSLCRLQLRRLERGQHAAAVASIERCLALRDRMRDLGGRLHLWRHMVHWPGRGQPRRVATRATC